MNAAPALGKDTTGLGLAGATEGVVDHEGRGNGAPGVGCVAAERPDQGRLGDWPAKEFRVEDGGREGWGRKGTLIC